MSNQATLGSQVAQTPAEHDMETASLSSCRGAYSAGSVSSASGACCCPSFAAAEGASSCLWCAGQGLSDRSTPLMGPHLSCSADRVARSISPGSCQASSTGRVQLRCSRSTCTGRDDRLSVATHTMSRWWLWSGCSVDGLHLGTAGASAVLGVLFSPDNRGLCCSKSSQLQRLHPP